MALLERVLIGGGGAGGASSAAVRPPPGTALMREPSSAQVLGVVALFARQAGACMDWDEMSSLKRYERGLAVTRLHQPTLSVAIVLQLTARWLAETRRYARKLEALLVGGAAPAELRRALSAPRSVAALIDDVPPLVPGSPDAAAFHALVSLLTTTLVQRGRSAHAALARYGAPLLTLLSLARMWSVEAAGRRDLAALASFMCEAIAVSAAAYAAERGDDGGGGVGGGGPAPVLPALLRSRESAADSPPLRGTCVLPRIAHEVGTAFAVPLCLRPLNAVTGGSLPAALLGSWAPAPRLQAETHADAIIPALLRLSPALLNPSALRLLEARSAAAAGSSTVTANAATVDLTSIVSSSVRLASEALYYRHAAATHATLAGPAAAMHVSWLLGGEIAGMTAAASPLTWPQLLASVCASSTAESGAVARHSAGAEAPSLIHMELLAAAVATHPDVLPRGGPTSSVLRGLAGELRACKARDDDLVLSVCRAALVLLDAASRRCGGVSDKASLTPPWLDPERLFASQPTDGEGGFHAIACAFTVDVGPEAARDLQPFAETALRSATAIGSVPSQVAAFASPIAALPWLWPNSASGAVASLSQSPPELELASEAANRLGHAVDSVRVSELLTSAIATAVNEEKAAWQDIVGALTRVAIPVYHSRRRLRPLQATLRLLARIAAVSEPEGPAVKPPTRRTTPLLPATNVTSHLILVPSANLPALTIPWSRSIAEATLSLPFFADARPHEIAPADGSEVVGVALAIPPATGEAELAAVMCDPHYPWLLRQRPGAALGGETVDSRDTWMDPLRLADGYDETVSDAQCLCAATPTLLQSGKDSVDVETAIRASFPIRMLLWQLLRVKAESRTAALRPRIDAWEGSQSAILSTCRGLTHQLLQIQRPAAHPCSFAWPRGACVVDGAAASTGDSSQHRGMQGPGGVAPGLLALPLVTQPSFSRAASLLFKLAAPIVAGEVSMCPNGGAATAHVRAAQSLVLSALHDSASASMELVIPGVFETDGEVAEYDASGDHAGARELLAAAAVAAYSQCTSTLQLQRVLHVYSVFCAFLPLFSGSAPLASRATALSASLVAFIAIHLAPTLEHCLGITARLVSSPPPEVTGTTRLPPHFVVQGASSALDSKTAGLAVNTGRAFQILHSIRACFCVPVVLGMGPEDASVALSRAQTITPMTAVCWAHIQAVTMATIQRISSLPPELGASIVPALWARVLRNAIAGASDPIARASEQHSSASAEASVGQLKRRRDDHCDNSDDALKHSARDPTQSSRRGPACLSDDDDEDDGRAPPSGSGAAAKKPRVPESPGAHAAMSGRTQSQSEAMSQPPPRSAAYNRASVSVSRSAGPSRSAQVPSSSVPVQIVEDDIFDSEFKPVNRVKPALGYSTGVAVAAPTFGRGDADDDDDSAAFDAFGSSAGGDTQVPAEWDSGVREDDDFVVEHYISLAADLVAVLDVVSASLCAGVFLPLPEDRVLGTHGAAAASGSAREQTSLVQSTLALVQKSYISTLLVPLHEPRRRGDAGTGATLAAALRSVCHMAPGVQSVGGIGAALAAAALALSPHVLYAEARTSVSKSIAAGILSHLPSIISSPEDILVAGNTIAGAALLNDAQDALRDRVEQTCWAGCLRSLAAVATRLAMQEVLCCDRRAFQTATAAVRSIFSSASAAPTALGSVLKRVLEVGIRAALFDGASRDLPRTLVHLLRNQNRLLSRAVDRSDASFGPAIAAAAATLAERAASADHFWHFELPECHAGFSEASLRSLPHRVFAPDFHAALPVTITPFGASFDPSGGARKDSRFISGRVYTAASLSFGLLYHLDTLSGSTALPVEDPAGVRVAQMQAAYDLLSLCPPGDLDVALEAVEGNLRQAHAAVGVVGSAFPRGLRPGLDWFPRLLVERGTNSAYPRVRAAAARLIPLACREITLGKLFDREETAKMDAAVDPYAPRVWRMLPLPPPSPAALASLLATWELSAPAAASTAGGGAVTLVAPCDSMQETDGMTVDRYISALWVVAGVVAQSPPEAGTAAVELLGRCSFSNPWHGVARRALHWAAYAAGGVSLAGLLRGAAEHVIAAWMAKGWSWSAFPCDLLGFQSLQTFLAAYRPVLTAQAVLASGFRRAAFCTGTAAPTTTLPASIDAERGRLRAYFGDVSAALVRAGGMGSLAGHSHVTKAQYDVIPILRQWRSSTNDNIAVPRGSCIELVEIVQTLKRPCVQLVDVPDAVGRVAIDAALPLPGGAFDVSILREGIEIELVDYSTGAIRVPSGISRGDLPAVTAEEIVALLSDHMGTVLATLLPFGLVSTDPLPAADGGEGGLDAVYRVQPLVFAASLANLLDAWRACADKSDKTMLDFIVFAADLLRGDMTPAALATSRSFLVSQSGHHAVLGCSDSLPHLLLPEVSYSCVMDALGAWGRHGLRSAEPPIQDPPPYSALLQSHPYALVLQVRLVSATASSKAVAALSWSQAASAREAAFSALDIASQIDSRNALPSLPGSLASTSPNAAPWVHLTELAAQQLAIAISAAAVSIRADGIDDAVPAALVRSLVASGAGVLRDGLTVVTACCAVNCEGLPAVKSDRVLLLVDSIKAVAAALILLCKAIVTNTNLYLQQQGVSGGAASQRGDSRISAAPSPSASPPAAAGLDTADAAVVRRSLEKFVALCDVCECSVALVLLGITRLLLIVANEEDERVGFSSLALRVTAQDLGVCMLDSLHDFLEPLRQFSRSSLTTSARGLSAAVCRRIDVAFGALADACVSAVAGGDAAAKTALHCNLLGLPPQRGSTPAIESKQWHVRHLGWLIRSHLGVKRESTEEEENVCLPGASREEVARGPRDDDCEQDLSRKVGGAVLYATASIHGLAIDDAIALEAGAQGSLTLSAGLAPALIALSVLHQSLIAGILGDATLLPSAAMRAIGMSAPAAPAVIALCTSILHSMGSALAPLSSWPEDNGSQSGKTCARTLGLLAWRCVALMGHYYPAVAAQRDYTSHTEPGAKSAALESPAELLRVLASPFGHVHGHTCSGLMETPFLWKLTTESGGTAESDEAARRGSKSGALSPSSATQQVFRYTFMWSKKDEFLRRKEALGRLQRSYSGGGDSTPLDGAVGSPRGMISGHPSILPLPTLDTLTLPLCLLGTSAVADLLMGHDASISQRRTPVQLVCEGVPVLHFAPDVPLFAPVLFSRVRIAGAVSRLVLAADLCSGACTPGGALDDLRRQGSPAVVPEWLPILPNRYSHSIPSATAFVQPEWDYAYHSLWLSDAAAPAATVGFGAGSGSLALRTFLVAARFIHTTGGSKAIAGLPGRLREPLQQLMSRHRVWAMPMAAGPSSLRPPRTARPGLASRLGLLPRDHALGAQRSSKSENGALLYNDLRLGGADPLGYAAATSVSSQTGPPRQLVLDDALAPSLWQLPSASVYADPGVGAVLGGYSLAETAAPALALGLSAHYSLRAVCTLVLGLPALARTVFPLVVAATLLEHAPGLPLRKLRTGGLPDGIENAAADDVLMADGEEAPSVEGEDERASGVHSNLVPIFGLGGSGADVGCTSLSTSRHATVNTFAELLATAREEASVGLAPDARQRSSSRCAARFSRVSLGGGGVAAEDLQYLAIDAAAASTASGEVATHDPCDVSTLWVSRVRVDLSARFMQLLRQASKDAGAISAVSATSARLVIESTDFLRSMRRALSDAACIQPDLKVDITNAREVASGESRTASGKIVSLLAPDALDWQAARTLFRQADGDATADGAGLQALSCALDLDYLAVAEAAAHVASRPADGLLHAELWCLDSFGSPPSISPASADVATSISVQVQRLVAAAHVFCGSRGRDAGSAPLLRSQRRLHAQCTGASAMAAGDWPDIVGVFMQAYESLDDPDALRGVTGVSGLAPRRSEFFAGVAENARSLSLGWAPPPQMHSLPAVLRPSCASQASDVEVLWRVARHRAAWGDALCYADAACSGRELSLPLLESVDNLQLRSLGGLARAVDHGHRAVRQPAVHDVAVVAAAELRDLAHAVGGIRLDSLDEGQAPSSASRALARALRLLEAVCVAPLVAPPFTGGGHGSCRPPCVLAGSSAGAAETGSAYLGREAVLRGLFSSPSSECTPPAASIRALLQHSVSTASRISEARAARLAGAAPVSAVQLAELSSLVLQAGAPVEAVEPSSGSSRGGAAWRAWSALESAVASAAVLFEKARLAWASSDPEAALSLALASAHATVGAALDALCLPPREAQWLIASAPSLVDSLCSVLLCCGEWLTASGLGTEAARGAAGNHTEDPFMSHLGRHGGAARPPLAPLRAVLELIAYRLLRWPAAGLDSLSATGGGGGGGAALLNRSMTVAAAPAGGSTGGGGVGGRRGRSGTGGSSGLRMQQESRSASLYFAAVQALAVSLPGSPPPPSPPSAPAPAYAGPTTAVSSAPCRGAQARAILSLATYADAALATAMAQRGSAEQAALNAHAASRKRALNQAAAEVKALEARGLGTAAKGKPPTAEQADNMRLLRLFVAELTANCKEDEEAAAAATLALAAHQHMAIRNYASYLRLVVPGDPGTGGVCGGDDEEGGIGATQELRVVFRLISLLFDHAGDAAAVGLLGLELSTIPVARLLPALPQITSRLGPDPGAAASFKVPSGPAAGASSRAASSSSSSGRAVDEWATRLPADQWTFGGIIEALLLRMLVAAPYRAVFPLLAIAKGSMAPAAAAEGSAAPTALPLPKVAAAWRVLGAARALAPALATIVDAATLLSDAYLSVAAVTVAREERMNTFSMAKTAITRMAVGGGGGGGGVAAAASLAGHGQPLTWLASSAARPLLDAMPVITAYHTDAMPVAALGSYARGGGAPEDAVAAAYSLPVHLRRGL